MLACLLCPTLLLAPLQETPELALGRWRAWLASPGGELAFGLELERDPTGLELERDPTGHDWRAAVTNGPERIPVPRVEVSARKLVLGFDHYDSEITARITAEGELSGTWRKRSGPATWSELAFRASPGTAVHPAGAPPAIDVGGRWAVTFASDGEGAVGEFEQSDGGLLRGTFLTPTGDYRFLAGRVRGQGFELSCFDGAHAFLFRARLGEDGRLHGDFWSRDSWHDTWTARRDADARLADAFHQTSWRADVSLADLVFPDLDGVPRSLGDPSFAGRARIVQLFGSWCPNCHDEAPYLVELHRRYRDRGLSIVGVAFELTGDFERDARQVRRYAERYGVEYPLLVAGLADKAKATRSFPGIDRLRSYPTTIFFDARGRVRSVHSGFAGPATGAAHRELRRQFEALIEELLDEEPAGDSAAWDLLAAHTWRSRAEFAGATYAFFTDADGRRRARRTLLGSGRPVLGSETLAVRLNGDAVLVGERLLRLDATAGVLLDPRNVNGRLVPTDHGAGTLLDDRGLTDEAAWLAALDDVDARLRREALVALARLREPRGDARLPEALALLDDPAPDVRLHAVWALGRVGQPEARGPLLDLLDDPNAALRREAVVALARIGGGPAADPDLAARLAALAGDPDPLVRAAVARVTSGR